MAVFPLIPNRVPRADRAGAKSFPFTDKICATMQPESGIIDCAFENS
jgi:hypothetical protein